MSDRARDFGTLKLLINGNWIESRSEETHDILNPAEGRLIGKVPFSTKEEVEAAALAAANAYESWGEASMGDRLQRLFRLKQTLEAHVEELTVLNTLNHGKTPQEGCGDLRRTVENVEAAI